MFARLGVLGVLALVVAIGATCAAVFQKSFAAAVIAVPAAAYVLIQLFRPADA